MPQRGLSVSGAWRFPLELPHDEMTLLTNSRPQSFILASCAIAHGSSTRRKTRRGMSSFTLMVWGIHGRWKVALDHSGMFYFPHTHRPHQCLAESTHCKSAEHLYIQPSLHHLMLGLSVGTLSSQTFLETLTPENNVLVWQEVVMKVRTLWR